jgi:hypothetical protein
VATNKESQIGERKEKRPTSSSSLVATTHLMAPPALPVEPWNRSSMTQEKLEELVEEGLLYPVTDIVAPEWIAPGVGVDVLNPLVGYVLSFMVFHERGLGILASRFLRVLPVWYEVELHNFNPNSIS